MEYTDFHNIFISTLEKHAPLKKRYIRANNGPYMNKTLNCAVMLRSKLRNKFLKDRSDVSRKAYNKQRNYCVALFRKEKKKYYENLNIKHITDNKKFWKTVKPFFSDKKSPHTTVMLKENESVICDDAKCAEIFNNHFGNTINELDIDRTIHARHVVGIDDPIQKAIAKYVSHPSILRIKNMVNTTEPFDFCNVSEEQVKLEILKMDSSKATPSDSIPIKILKLNVDACSPPICSSYKNSLTSGKFPNELKHADLTPAFKRDDRLCKTNYRPISILPAVSKIYEKIMYRQLYAFFNSLLSKYLCGFRKGFNSQNCLIVMLEKLRKTLDNGGFTGILLTDLSKAFDCLQHDLLIAKLDAYGCSVNSLRLMHNYLTGRSHRTKINQTYSTWVDILYGVPQGSILGPLLFNIYINDLFMFTEAFEIANYADDCTPYECKDTLEDVIESLERDSLVLLQWYANNYLEPNVGKYHLLLSDKDENWAIQVATKTIFNSTHEKLLGITFDNKLTFDAHVSKLCDTAGQKLHALARIFTFMSFEKRKAIINAFILSQFSYCPLIWMFHSRKLNARINKIHERALRILFQDKHSSFIELLKKAGMIKIHHRNLQALATEMFKVKNNMSPLIMHDVFIQRSVKYNLRNKTEFATHVPHSVTQGTETLSYLGPKIWSLIPDKIKESTTLPIFKKNIKVWVPEKCPCRLCKTYIANVGFV